jgi:hypothetical protein
MNTLQWEKLPINLEAFGRGEKDVQRVRSVNITPPWNTYNFKALLQLKIATDDGNSPVKS